MSNSNMRRASTVFLTSMLEKHIIISTYKTVQCTKKLPKIVLYPDVQKDIEKEKDSFLCTWKSVQCVLFKILN